METARPLQSRTGFKDYSKLFIPVGLQPRKVLRNRDQVVIKRAMTLRRQRQIRFEKIVSRQEGLREFEHELLPTEGLDEQVTLWVNPARSFNRYWF